MVVVLSPAPPGVVGIAAGTVLRERKIVSDLDDGNDRHLILQDRRGLHRVTILSQFHARGHHVAIVPDRYVEMRLAAFEQFAGKGASAATDRLYPSSAQNRRLKLMLQTLDFLDAKGRENATTRLVAETILFQRHELGRAIEWKTSTERRQTQRLVKTALHIMQGGFLNLLEGRMR